MKKQSTVILIAGALSILSFVNSAQSQTIYKLFAEWDYTLPSSFNKGVNEVAATGETGAGNTFYKFNESSPDNFSNSKVYDIANGYSVRKDIATGQIVRADTGMTSADRVGQAYMIINFSSWNLPGAGITMNFDAGSRTGIRLRSTAEGVYLGGWFGSWKEGVTPLFGLSAENISIAMEYDYVDGANNARIFYSTNGGLDWIDSGLYEDSRATGQIDFVKWGTVGQLGQIDDELYEFNIRSITVANSLYPIPEPSTYALLGGIFVLGTAVFIRRRQARR